MQLWLGVAGQELLRVLPNCSKTHGTESPKHCTQLSRWSAGIYDLGVISSNDSRQMDVLGIGPSLKGYLAADPRAIKCRGDGSQRCFPSRTSPANTPLLPLVLPGVCVQQLHVLHFPLSWLIPLSSPSLSSPAWGLSP